MTTSSEDRYNPLQWWLESRPWNSWKATGLTGLRGSSKSYVLSQWRDLSLKPSLVIVPRLQDAESLVEDLRFFQGKGIEPVLLFPQWETLPYDEIPPHPEIIRDRVRCLYSLLSGQGTMIVSPVRALMQKVLPPPTLKESILSLKVGEEVDREALIHFLDRAGYTSVKVIEERGDFSVRGAIVDIHSPLYEEPLRLEFDGDRLISIRRFEPETQRSIPQGEMEAVVLLPAKDIPNPLSDPSSASLFDYLTKDTVLFLAEGDVLEGEAEGYSRVVMEHYRRALMKKDSVPLPESAYLSFEDFKQLVERSHSLFLDEGPIGSSHCEQVLPFDFGGNRNLQTEMKAVLTPAASSSEASPFSVLIKELREWQGK